MLTKEIVRVKVTGGYACFTRPDLKVERMTYPCMTPSAARGILDSILWKPEFQWYVRRILVLNLVRFDSVKRNELKSKQGNEPIEIDALDNRFKPKHRSQRNSIILKDVAYVIEASIFQENFNTKNPPKKYIEIFERRVRKGQCFRRPFLGTREFAAEFMETDAMDLPIQDTIPIGSMLFDIFYDNGKPQPLFFYDVAIEKGVLNCEVPENDKMMQSTHYRPKEDDQFSALLYEFKEKEESEAQND